MRTLRRLVCVILASLAVGCFVAGSNEPTTTPGNAPPPSGGPIEAGCSYNGTNLPPGADGTVYQVACPADCAGPGGIYGTDAYTLDSAICKAGIHSGAIPPSGGVVQVRLEPGRPAYRGSPKNGIQSWDYGSYARSFVVVNAVSQAPAGAPAGTPSAIEAGCTFNATQIVAEVGTRHLVTCPAGCSGTGGVYGSGPYTADSAICKTAIHAGILTDQGGTVAVTIMAGQEAYRGSQKNGVTSFDYARYPKSITVSKP